MASFPERGRSRYRPSVIRLPVSIEWRRWSSTAPAATARRRPQASFGLRGSKRYRTWRAGTAPGKTPARPDGSDREGLAVPDAGCGWPDDAAGLWGVGLSL